VWIGGGEEKQREDLVRAAMQLDFIDLKRQQQRIRSSLDARIKKVLDSGLYIMGPEIAELEGQLAEYVGVKHCVSCANGTDALVMSLMALEVGPGDAVFTVPFTFMATAEAIALVGATTVFVDIDEKTFNIDPNKLESAIVKARNEKPHLHLRGIIPVDLFGQPADYQEIQAIAQLHNMFVLEDAAQSFGATYFGKRTGSFGEIATTSFFPAKPLGCYGDGGAIFTNNETFAEKLKSIRVHGQGVDKYENVRIGLNGRLDTLQAAVLLAKLEIFEEELRLREDVAQRYNALLDDRVRTPFIAPNRTSAWAQYSVVTEQRDATLKLLTERKIPTAIYYPVPLHLQKAFSNLGYRAGDLPFSERLAKNIFSIPMHPYLTEAEQEFIGRAITGDKHS
jgi:UDP-2-acetamido-2-deoxy-ribo-hexuluronate aminotransferase